MPQKGNNSLKNFIKFLNSKINKKKIKVQNFPKNFNISTKLKKIKKFQKLKPIIEVVTKAGLTNLIEVVTKAGLTYLIEVVTKAGLTLTRGGH